jgi:hypothetical protein
MAFRSFKHGGQRVEWVVLSSKTVQPVEYTTADAMFKSVLPWQLLHCATAFNVSEGDLLSHGTTLSLIVTVTDLVSIS